MGCLLLPFTPHLTPEHRLCLIVLTNKVLGVSSLPIHWAWASQCEVMWFSSVLGLP